MNTNSGKRALLRNRAFRRLWLGQAVSSVGDGVFPVAIVAGILGHGHKSGLGLVLGADSLGAVLVTLVGGVLADRMRRTRLMAAADLLRLAAATAFLLGAGGGPLAVPMLLAAAMGVGAGLFRPAYAALLPSIVPGELAPANALRSVTTRVAAIVGPGLGGLLVAVGGTRAAFGFDAATFAVSVLTLIGITDTAPARGAGEGLAAEARAGVAAVLRRPWVAAIIAQGTVQLLLVMAPTLVLLPLVLDNHGHLAEYGPMMGLQAAGSALGGFAAGMWRPKQPGTAAVLGLTFVGFQLVCLLASAPAVLLGAASVATGFGYALFGVLWTGALQRSIPDELLGRVFAVEMVGTYALEPVALALTPAAVTLLGPTATLAVALVALAATTIIPLLVPGVRMFADPERPSVPHPAPNPVEVTS